MAWYFYIFATESPMSIVIVLAALAVGVVIGAYSHKWLAKVTGAPVNITASAAGLASAAKQVEQTVVKKV